MGLRNARRFHAALGGLPWLAGVIPTALDDEGREWLRSRPEGLTVAMHGVTHRRAGGFDSEFRDMNTVEVAKELRRGLSLLGVPARHFIPPYNALEPQLVEVIRNSDLEVVWGHYDTCPKPPIHHGRHTFVPSFFNLYSATTCSMGPGQAPVIDAVHQFIPGNGFAVITLHLPWELAKSDQNDFNGVRELARVIKDYVVTPDWYAEEAR